MYSLCSPVFVPQMVGGLMPPPPLVTENVSVRHWPLSVTEVDPPGATTPASTPYNIYTVLLLELRLMHQYISMHLRQFLQKSNHFGVGVMLVCEK